MSALREEAVGLREALDAQRTQLERHYAGLHAKMRKEYEQVWGGHARLQVAQQQHWTQTTQLGHSAGVTPYTSANNRMLTSTGIRVSPVLQSLRTLVCIVMTSALSPTSTIPSEAGAWLGQRPTPQLV